MFIRVKKESIALVIYKKMCCIINEIPCTDDIDCTNSCTLTIP